MVDRRERGLRKGVVLRWESVGVGWKEGVWKEKGGKRMV